MVRIVWQRVLGEEEMNCDQLAKSCGLAQTFSRTIKMQHLPWQKPLPSCPGIMDAFRWVESGLDGISFNWYGFLMSDILLYPFCYTSKDDFRTWSLRKESTNGFPVMAKLGADGGLWWSRSPVGLRQPEQRCSGMDWNGWSSRPVVKYFFVTCCACDLAVNLSEILLSFCWLYGIGSSEVCCMNLYDCVMLFFCCGSSLHFAPLNIPSSEGLVISKESSKG